MVGFALMQATADPHGYWILLTIVFVSQPQYAATQTRLMERAKGTAMGLALGWAVIQLFPGELVQAALLVLGGAVFLGRGTPAIPWLRRLSPPCCCSAFTRWARPAA